MFTVHIVTGKTTDSQGNIIDDKGVIAARWCYKDAQDLIMKEVGDNDHIQSRSMNPVHYAWKAKDVHYLYTITTCEPK